MRTSLLLAAVSAVVIPTAVAAQVTGVITSRTVAYKSIGPYGAYPNPVSKTNSAFELGAGDATQKVENYQVSANVGPDEIDFADNTTTQGYIALTTASTSIDVTYTNGGARTVTPKLQSTILPGGFGFYMANPSGNPTQTGYGTGDVNQSPQAATATFAGYEAYGSPGPQVVAAFSFTILSDGVAVYSLADSVSLSLDSGSPVITYAAPVALKGFHLLTPAGSQAAVAYQWDATTIDVPLGVSLAPGESSTLTYQTSVTTSTNILYPDLTAQVLAFAGFGDPIGKTTGAGGIPDPYFAQLVLAYPTFDPVTGKVGLPALPKSLPSLTFPGQSPATYEPVPDAVLGVPEPGAWALVLAGLALVGGASRRRQRAA